jgi:hypothetical protein
MVIGDGIIQLSQVFEGKPLENEMGDLPRKRKQMDERSS